MQLFRLAEGNANCGSSDGPATHLHRFGTADVQLMSLLCASSKLREMRQSHVTLRKVAQLPQKISKLCQIIRCHIQNPRNLQEYAVRTRPDVTQSEGVLSLPIVLSLQLFVLRAQSEVKLKSR